MDGPNGRPLENGISMIDFVIGAALIAASVCLWAYAARSSLAPQPKAWARGYEFTAPIALTAAAGLATGLAFVGSFAGSLGSPTGWIVFLGVVAAAFALHIALWRLLGLNTLYRDRLRDQTAGRLARGGQPAPRGAGTRKAA